MCGSFRYAVDLSSQLPCSDPIQLTPTGYYHNTEVHVVSYLVCKQFVLYF